MRAISLMSLKNEYDKVIRIVSNYGGDWMSGPSDLEELRLRRI